MRSKRIRRASVGLAALAAATTLSLGAPSPASANTLYGRIPAGGCITGIAVVVQGLPLCMVVD